MRHKGRPQKNHSSLGNPAEALHELAHHSSMPLKGIQMEVFSMTGSMVGQPPPIVLTPTLTQGVVVISTPPPPEYDTITGSMHGESSTHSATVVGSAQTPTNRTSVPTSITTNGNMDEESGNSNSTNSRAIPNMMVTPRPRLDFSPGGTTQEWHPNCPTHLKPKLGMSFATLQQGIDFYRSYAQSCGFSVRLGTEKKAKDGTIILKYLICSKEGFNAPKRKKECKQAVGTEIADGEEGESCQNDTQTRRRAITRMGCRAKMVLRVSAGQSYIVLQWKEGHTHRFATPSCRQFLKENRIMNIAKKKFIVDCSKNNIGPMRSYRIYKEIVGGYPNVGATIQDFKNFTRDLKAYIGGSDAQMVVDNLFRKRDINAAFYFDYDLDENDRLTRLFWADPISRKNYALFGDMLSFDTTYETNKYNLKFAPFTGVDHHKKCITFGVGLIDKEDVPSFVWLFNTFLKAMGHHEPTCLITDQDPAMNLAIPEVFKTCKHRYCMWHITEKIAKKVVPTIANGTDFIAKINKCIWDHHIEPEQFETQWMKVISEFNLEGHSWLSHMFDIRRSWIPAYFRDLFMGGLLRTTSRSESENNFFCNFVNPFVTLVEFMMRYESAMEAQRHSQSQLNHDSNLSSPELVTPLAIEKHASEVYTQSVFYELQEDIFAACFSCIIKSLMEDNEVRMWSVSPAKNPSKWCIIPQMEMQSAAAKSLNGMACCASIYFISLGVLISCLVNM